MSKIRYGFFSSAIVTELRQCAINRALSGAPYAYMDMMFGQAYKGTFDNVELALAFDLAAAVIEAGDYPLEGQL